MRLFLSFFFLFCHLLIVNGIIPRIIGGELARAGQFSFSAAIYTDTDTGRYFCGGALISNEWILTAAQCVSGARSFTINLGSNSLQKSDPNRVIVSTFEYTVHPDFNPFTLENDIGLIKLRLPVTFDYYIQRVLLPFAFTSDNSLVTAIGWGQTTAEGLAEDLQYVRLASISNDECKVAYGDQISDKMLCVAGEYNEGTCIGDTGSPLLDDDPVIIRHVGVASFISGNGCESVDPSGYTKTFSFVEWIRNVTSI